MKTLLIAPRSNLEHADSEVQNVANALSPQLLIGTVTVHDVLGALSHGAYDCVWFACHGNEDGIELSDGVLSASHLTQMLRRNTPKVIVLNTCSSLRTAMMLHDTLRAAVVATVIDVEDLTAYLTGSLFSRNLAANGGDVVQAYEQSLPGNNREFVLLNGSVRMGAANPADDVRAMMTHTLRCSNQVHESLNDVKAEIEKLRRELTTMYVQKPAPRHRWAWMVGAVILLTTVLATADTTVVTDLQAIGFYVLAGAIGVGLVAYGVRLWAP